MARLVMAIVLVIQGMKDRKEAAQVAQILRRLVPMRSRNAKEAVAGLLEGVPLRMDGNDGEAVRFLCAALREAGCICEISAEYENEA